VGRKQEEPVSTFYFRKELDLILSRAYNVQRVPGYCLTKKIYMDALEPELARAGLSVRGNAIPGMRTAGTPGKKRFMPGERPAETGGIWF
jgi:hypothetical protein